VTAVEGNFRRGDTVALLDTDEKEIGRGLCAYDSEEARKIIGRKSSEIAAVLGYSGRNVLVHHNDLAWTGTGKS
jgi:glutamate 5-kinase